MKPIDYLVLGIVLVLAALAVWYIVRHRGKCGGGCAGCPHASGLPGFQPERRCRGRPARLSAGAPLSRRRPFKGGDIPPLDPP